MLQKVHVAPKKTDSTQEHACMHVDLHTQTQACLKVEFDGSLHERTATVLNTYWYERQREATFSIVLFDFFFTFI